MGEANRTERGVLISLGPSLTGVHMISEFIFNIDFWGFTLHFTVFLSGFGFNSSFLFKVAEAKNTISYVARSDVCVNNKTLTNIKYTVDLMKMFLIFLNYGKNN